MIDRYTTPEMAKIWSDENKYETWKKVEITVTEVLSDRGEVPKEAVKVINKRIENIGKLNGDIGIKYSKFKYIKYFKNRI